MKDKKSRKADELLKMLAESSPNDAVKLLFLGEEDLSILDGLDLSLISEIKRSPSGAVEMKFVDRLAVLRELLELKKADEKQRDDGKSIFAALDRAAQQLKSEEKT
ncbi:MAG: XRE family transcriptional regulator [Bacillota bacterium]|nr:XRE family transcriptional regulator [Bacillota bacterium]